MEIKMQVFRNSEFGELGVLDVDGKPYFPATACAKTLGYKRPDDAITEHYKGSVKHRVLTDGGFQELKFILLFYHRDHEEQAETAARRSCGDNLPQLMMAG